MTQAYSRDPYVVGSSLLHRSDARLKLAGVFSYLLLVGAIPAQAWRAYLALLGLAAVAWCVSEVPPGRLLQRLLPIVALGAVAALGALFRTGEHQYWSGRFLWLHLAVSGEGVRQCGLLLVRAVLSGLVVAVYVAVTRFGDTVRALRRLGVPAALTATLSFVYRYIFVLVDEALRLDRAREARTLQEPSLARVGAQARTYAGLVGTLFLRAYDRSERVYQAMCARGFTGELRSLQEPHWTAADTRAGVVWTAALIGVAAVAWL